MPTSRSPPIASCKAAAEQGGPVGTLAAVEDAGADGGGLLDADVADVARAGGCSRCATVGRCCGWLGVGRRDADGVAVRDIDGVGLAGVGVAREGGSTVPVAARSAAVVLAGTGECAAGAASSPA